MKWQKLTNTEILTIWVEDTNAEDKALAVNAIYKNYKQGFIAVEWRDQYNIFSTIIEAVEHIIQLQYE